MPYEGFLSYAGVELVNTARTQAYSTVPIQCSCPWLAAALGDDDYTSPDQDQAEWFDPAAPESKDFHGLVGLAFTGADNATRTRQWTELLTSGGVPGAERHASREIEVKALAVAASNAGLSYGLSWLSAALSGSACLDGCEGDRLCVLTECPAPPEPDATVCAPDGDAGPTPPPGGGEWNPQQAGDAALRELFDVACIDGPLVQNTRHLAGGVVAEVVFTLKAGVPWWHRTPVPVAALTWGTLPDTTYTDTLPNYDPIRVLDDCPTDTATGDCLDENPYCALPPFPTEPILELPDPCYPTSVFTAQRAVNTIQSYSNPEWLTKVPIVTVRSGSLPLHRLTLRWYDNPLQQLCDASSVEPCQACSEITMPWMPRSSVLTLDGRTQSATLDCPGGATTAPESALYGPRGGLYRWPEFPCATSMCLEIVVDATGVARDFSVEVEMVTRGDTA